MGGKAVGIYGGAPLRCSSDGGAALPVGAGGGSSTLLNASGGSDALQLRSGAAGALQTGSGKGSGSAAALQHGGVAGTLLGGKDSSNSGGALQGGSGKSNSSGDALPHSGATSTLQTNKSSRAGVLQSCVGAQRVQPQMPAPPQRSTNVGASPARLAAPAALQVDAAVPAANAAEPDHEQIDGAENGGLKFGTRSAQDPAVQVGISTPFGHPPGFNVFTGGTHDPTVRTLAQSFYDIVGLPCRNLTVGKLLQ